MIGPECDKNTIREYRTSHFSFIAQLKSVNDRKQTRVKPYSLLLFCFSVSFLSLCVVHWPGGYEGGESTSNAPPGKSGKIRRRQQSWLMQCCTPRQCWQCWQYQPRWQLVPNCWKLVPNFWQSLRMESCTITSRQCCPAHMGQFLQGGKNGRLMSFFF